MAETSAHTEAPAGHTNFPPFESEHFPSQLVWLTISFVLFYVLMSRIALPRIGGIMAACNKVISDDLAAAEQLKEQSNAAQAAYEKALADARGRAQAIAGATRDQQARETEDLHERLEAQLHDRMAAAEQSIAKSRGAAMSREAPPELDCDMRPGDLIDQLRRLTFIDDDELVKVDRDVRDYLVASLSARHIARRA